MIRRSVAMVLAATLLASTSAVAQVQAADPMADGFRDPPATARPRVWWHWLNGKVTDDGIVKDLEWMKRIGQVGDLAEVRINGRVVGTAWHAPYRLDIGSAARPGANRIEVRVDNVWVNRLIGHAQPGAKPTTWTAMPSYKPDAPLRPAGLIGPVTIEGSR